MASTSRDPIEAQERGPSPRQRRRRLKDPKDLPSANAARAAKPKVKTQPEMDELRGHPDTPEGHAAKKAEMLLREAMSSSFEGERRTFFDKAREMVREHHLTVGAGA